MTDTDFEEEKKILKWLEKEVGFENYIDAIERDPSRLKSTFQKILDLKGKAKIVTVAGTNGKGEVCQNLSMFLKQQGITHTLFSSPHVFTIRERFQSDGQLIEYSELKSLCEETLGVVKEKKIVVSYFEFLFLSFLIFTKKRSPRIIILEVGLGGRLDATNLLDTDLALLTSISRDHQKFLGNSLSSILSEKLAISRKRKVLVTNLESHYLRRLARKYAYEKEVFHIDLFDVEVSSIEDSFQNLNFKLARFALIQLGMREKISSMKQYKRKWELKALNKKFDFYGSHNPEGLRKTMNLVCKSQDKFGFIIASFSQRPKKDIMTMLSTLLAYKPKKCRILITLNDNFKSFSSKQLEEILNAPNFQQIEFVPDWEKLALCFKESSDTRVLVTGSYYFISPFFDFLQQSKLCS